MTPTSFIIAGCNICREFDKATLLYNLTAPLGEKIDLIGIHSQDSRITALEKVHPGEMVKLPTTIIDLNSGLKQLGITEVKPSLRVAVISSAILEYNLNFLRLLNGDDFNLY